MATRRSRAALVAALLLVAAPAARGEDWTVGPPYTRGTNVYPPAGSGPPGSAAEDLYNYRSRSHAHHGTTEQTCPDGQPGCAAPTINVTFSGDTGLGVAQIPGAFAIIAGIGAQQLKCNGLTAVKAELLKAADVPPNDLDKDIGVPSDYERWTATLCGKQVAFLLGVWSDDGNHPPFRIVYPFAP